MASDDVMEMDPKLPQPPSSEQAEVTSATDENGNHENNENNKKSALQDNIDRKGNNAYYFAHSHKANGPAWDGKAEPRLLNKQVSNNDNNNGGAPGVWHRSSSSTFDYAKSNITSYAFLDEPTKVKLYIDLPNVGEQCQDDDLQLDYTERSFSLQVRNYQNSTSPTTTATPCLCFARLSGTITSATVKRKEHKLIVTLTKANPNVTWHTIHDKGSADHDVV